MSAHEEDASSTCPKCGQTFDVHAALSPDCDGESPDECTCAEFLLGCPLHTNEPISEQELQEIERRLAGWETGKIWRVTSEVRRLRAVLEDTGNGLCDAVDEAERLRSRLETVRVTLEGLGLRMVWKPK